MNSNNKILFVLLLCTLFISGCVSTQSPGDNFSPLSSTPINVEGNIKSPTQKIMYIDVYALENILTSPYMENSSKYSDLNMVTGKYSDDLLVHNMVFKKYTNMDVSWPKIGPILRQTYDLHGYVTLEYDVEFHSDITGRVEPYHLKTWIVQANNIGGVVGDIIRTELILRHHVMMDKKIMIPDEALILSKGNWVYNENTKIVSRSDMNKYINNFWIRTKSTDNEEPFRGRYATANFDEVKQAYEKTITNTPINEIPGAVLFFSPLNDMYYVEFTENNFIVITIGFFNAQTQQEKPVVAAANQIFDLIGYQITLLSDEKNPDTMPLKMPFNSSLSEVK